MAIVGYHYDPAGVDAVYYAITDDYPKEARRIRWLLVWALLLSVLSAGQSVLLASDAYRGAKEARARVRVAAESPQVRAGLVMGVRSLQEAQQAPPEAGEAPITSRARTALQSVQVSEAEVDLYLRESQDVVAMLESLTGDLMLVFLVVLCYFPIKYGLLWRGVRRGNPEVLTAIRRTARRQVALELGRLLLVGDMNASAQELSLPNSWSWAMVAACLILLYARTEKVREFFSAYRVRPATPEVIERFQTEQAEQAGQAGPAEASAPAAEGAAPGAVAPSFQPPPLD